jgi:hypothetical protein
MDDKFVAAKTIVFVHIPKTAGTSFTGYLKTGLLDASKDQTLGQGFNKELFCSHEYLYLSYARMSQAYFVTFLREPISRTISQYKSLRNPSNYQANWRDGLDEKQVEALEFCQRATFREFINSTNEAVLGHIVNAQTRMLSDHCVTVSESMDNIINRVILSSACENLVRKVNFLGICEMINASLAMFRHETGIDGTLSQLNRSEAYDVSFTSADRAKLGDLLEMDFHLYNFGIRIFDRKVGNLLRNGISRRR